MLKRLNKWELWLLKNATSTGENPEKYVLWLLKIELKAVAEFIICG